MIGSFDLGRVISPRGGSVNGSLVTSRADSLIPPMAFALTRLARGLSVQKRTLGNDVVRVDLAECVGEELIGVHLTEDTSTRVYVSFGVDRLDYLTYRDVGHRIVGRVAEDQLAPTSLA